MKKIITIWIIGIFVLSGIGVAVASYSKSIMDNRPPNAPEITGPTFTRPGPHEWRFKAIDPDGDNISYEIDWGDGIIEKWIGPFTSGEEVTLSHSYSMKMTARIAARANDTHGAIGDWGYLNVVISKSKQTIYLTFLQLLERFPHAFPLLRFLLEFNH